jgi:signal transduction histidine kinase
MSFNIMTEKLNHSFHELELMNQELQIKIDQLKTANQIAEKANQVKSEFISQMSHELRTPLNSILGFSQILDEDHEISDGKKHFVQGILASGYKLLELINNVISLCNQEQKEESLALSVVAVDDVLHEVIDHFRGRLKSLNLSLTYHLEPRVPQYVQTDVYCLKKILKNLVDNAVKFTPKGQITIKVNLLSDDNIDRLSAKMPSYLTFNSTPVDWFQWEIQDTGCGI